MKISSLAQVAFVLVLVGGTSTFGTALAPNCEYIMSEAPSGTDCNHLPSPPPGTAVATGLECQYNYCNSAATCESDGTKWQKILRKKGLWKHTDSGTGAVTYYSGSVHDYTDGCCRCVTTYSATPVEP